MLGIVDFYNPEESITPYEAFRCYTINPARAILEEDERGTLEVGKAADFFHGRRRPLYTGTKGHRILPTGMHLLRRPPLPQKKRDRCGTRMVYAEKSQACITKSGKVTGKESVQLKD